MYMDGRLVIRQYNQWDSQPTGQLAHICRIIACGCKRAELMERLKHTVLMSRDTVRRLASLHDNPDRIHLAPGDTDVVRDLANFTVLANRDWGAEILDYVLCMNHCGCYGETYTGRDQKEVDVRYKMPDWAYIFNDDGELEPQEGNYYLFLNSDGSYVVEGIWHGLFKRWEDEVPTTKELEEYMDEAERRGSE